MAKRGNGEGSVGKHKNGWRSRLTIGTKDNGKSLIKEFYGKTRKEALSKMDEYKVQMALGTLPNDDKITVSEWFYTWLFEYRIKDLKPKSFEKYEGIYRNYIQDSTLGKTKLKDLRTTHLQQYYNKLIDIDKKPPSTIKGLNTRIKPCLAEAERQGYILKNYCKLVTLPKDNSTKTIKILSLDEQNKFIESLKGHDLEILFLVALSTGLRLGELLGLKWSDIDFDGGYLTVNRTLQRITQISKDGKRESKLIEQTPKSKNSHREVPIPRNILLKLKINRLEQSKNRLSLGELYFNNDYVFCNNIGHPIDDKRPARNLKSILTKIGIEPIKFHALRHTYATRLFENDVPPKTVQMLMGHYDISITMDIYTHVMQDKKLEAVEKLDSIFAL